MITIAKNYTKKRKEKKKEKWRDRTLGLMIKAELYRQNHSQKHTHTDSQEVKNGKKKNIYIYIVSPNVHLLNLV